MLETYLPPHRYLTLSLPLNIQRWVDPFFDLEQFHTKGPVEDELTKEAESDEEERRIASERLLHDIMQPKWMEKEVLDGEYTRRRRRRRSRIEKG
jgi:hypothetical protein